MKLLCKAFASRRAQGTLAHDLASAFGPDAPQGLRMIKDSPQARVAEARWRGDPVIVKQLHTPDPRGAIAAMEAEHDRLRALFPHGGLDAGLLRATSAPHGIAILQRVPGQRLDAVLDHCGAASRAVLVTKAGAWLARSMAGARETGAFFPRFWVGRLKTESAEAQLEAPDRALVTEALRALRGLGRSLRKGPVPRGPIHADFGLHNIFWDEDSGTLAAFDIQKTTMLPLGLDLARLLVALSAQMQRQYPACALKAGILAADRDALMNLPDLAHDASEARFLDFFLGHRMIKALIDKHAHPHAPIYRRSLESWHAEVPCP